MSFGVLSGSFIGGTVGYGMVRVISYVADVSVDERKLRFGISSLVAGHFLGAIKHICPNVMNRACLYVTTGGILYFVNYR